MTLPRHQRRRSLGQSLRRAAITPVLVVAGVAAGHGVVRLAIDAGLAPEMTVHDTSLGSPSHDTMLTREQRHAQEVRALVDVHDCWTGSDDVPADLRGRYPGHVVVTVTRASRPTYSAALVGAALDHVFGTDAGPDMTVHAFCR